MNLSHIFEKIETRFFKNESHSIVFNEVNFELYFDAAIKSYSIDYLISFLNKENSTEKENKNSYSIYTLIDPSFYHQIRDHFSKKEGKNKEIFKNLFLMEYEEQDSKIFCDFNSNEHLIIIIKNFQIVILAREIQPILVRYFLRIIREILIRESENSGSILFHASALRIKNNGILIPGKKGAGKSSLMAYLLFNKEAKFINNDRVFLSLKNNLNYLPLPIRFSVETVRSFSDSIPFPFSKKRVNESNTKIEITPKELSQVFSRELISEAPLKRIFFPAFDQTISKCDVEQLNKEETRIFLKESCFTPYDENWTNAWIIKREKTDAELEGFAEKRLDQIINNYSSYRIKFGPKNCPEEILLNIEKEGLLF